MTSFISTNEKVLMTCNEIMAELREMGDPKIKAIFLKHGVKEPLFGVRIEQLKTIQKKIRKDYHLAKELYATGNADAMYLAGLIADDEMMTKEDLQTWIKNSTSSSVCEFTVPWVATGSRYGDELAREWIGSSEENTAAAGWATLSGLVSVKRDEELDMPFLRSLLKKIPSIIHKAPNRVRYNMNGFIISVGAYVTPLTDEAIAAARKTGVVSVDMSGTACKVPDAVAYINKIRERGSLGRKRKTVKC
jgi:3-methyladenine DNA glycosylase AlkD